MLAIFDKPDPLDGPFFEETIYVTPSQSLAASCNRRLSSPWVWPPARSDCPTVRFTPSAGRRTRGCIVLEVAARPIGGLVRACPALLAEGGPRASSPEPVSLEELLLRHALGESTEDWRREDGGLGRDDDSDSARAACFAACRASTRPGGRRLVEDIRITAKPDQVLVPLPEGASYLGFIFARGDSPSEVERALRDAHGRLRFTIDPEVRVLQSPHG